jgi:hypothetical protein
MLSSSSSSSSSVKLLTKVGRDVHGEELLRQLEVGGVLCVCVCMCVREIERERERQRVIHNDLIHVKTPHHTHPTIVGEQAAGVDTSLVIRDAQQSTSLAVLPILASSGARCVSRYLVRELASLLMG